MLNWCHLMPHTRPVFVFFFSSYCWYLWEISNRSSCQLFNIVWIIIQKNLCIVLKQFGRELHCSGSWKFQLVIPLERNVLEQYLTVLNWLITWEEKFISFGYAKCRLIISFLLFLRETTRPLPLQKLGEWRNKLWF